MKTIFSIPTRDGTRGLPACLWLLELGAFLRSPLAPAVPDRRLVPPPSPGLTPRASFSLLEHRKDQLWRR